MNNKKATKNEPAIVKNCPTLILFSPPENQTNEIEQLIQMFELGLPLFHLRKPTFSQQEMSNYLSKVPMIYHSKIVVHSNYGVSNQFNLKGIHLTERSRKKITNLHNLYKIVSTSFHNFEDWENQQHLFEYCFLSPIFDSISKKGYKKAFDYEILNEKLSKKATFTMALGGIQIDNIQKSIALGFDGVACIGTVWEAKNPLVVIKKMLNELKNV